MRGLTTVAHRPYRIGVKMDGTCTGSSAEPLCPRRPLWEQGREKIGRFLAALLLLHGGGCAAGDRQGVWQDIPPSQASTSSSSTSSTGADPQGLPDASTATADWPSSTANASSSSSVSSKTGSSSQGSSTGSASEETDSQPEESPEPDPIPNAPACGLQISRVSVNQSLEFEICNDGEALPMEGDRKRIWTGRKTFFRVYLRHLTANPRPIKVTLEVNNRGKSWAQRKELLLTRSSSPRVLDSTVNFVVPADMMGTAAFYRVYATQDDGCAKEPQDRPLVPATGMWPLGLQAAPAMELQLVRLHFRDQPEPEPFSSEFKQRLQEALLARFPLSAIRFDPWAELTVLVPSPSPVEEAINPLARSVAMIKALQEVRDQFADGSSKVHFLGFGDLEDMGSGMGAPSNRPEPGTAVVNLSADQERLMRRTIVMSGRLFGLSNDYCDMGSTSGDPGKIEVWGFDASREKNLDPDLYFDLTCSRKPAWIHRPSYRQLARRARAIASK